MGPGGFSFVVRRSVKKPLDGPAVDIETCSIRFSSVPCASWPNWLSFSFCGDFSNKSRDRPATNIDKSRVCFSSVPSATFPNCFSSVLCWSVLKLLARPVRDIARFRLRFSSVTRASLSNWFSSPRPGRSGFSFVWRWLFKQIFGRTGGRQRQMSRSFLFRYWRDLSPRFLFTGPSMKVGPERPETRSYFKGSYFIFGIFSPQSLTKIDVVARGGSSGHLPFIVPGCFS